MPVNTITTGEEQEGRAPSDNRSSNRLTFRQLQRMAPYAGGPLPPDDAFVAVSFFDISQGGFSYMADQIPAYDELLVAMQVHSEVIYVKARIVHHRASPQGFVIGCQFGDRLTVE